MADRYKASIDDMFFFECETLEDSFEKVIVRHEFPFRAGALLQDMGQTARDIKIRLYFMNENYEAHKKLIAHLDAVDHLQQRVVLPHAHREDDRERRDAEDEPRAQLVEVLDEGQPCIMLDRLCGLDAGGHGGRGGRRSAGSGARGRAGRCLVGRGGGLVGLGLRQLRRLVVLVLVLVGARDGLLELAHAGPQLLAEPGQALGPEDDQDDQQDDADFERSDVGHGCSVILASWATESSAPARTSDHFSRQE